MRHSPRLLPWQHATSPTAETAASAWLEQSLARSRCALKKLEFKDAVRFYLGMSPRGQELQMQVFTFQDPMTDLPHMLHCRHLARRKTRHNALLDDIHKWLLARCSERRSIQSAVARTEPTTWCHRDGTRDTLLFHRKRGRTRRTKQSARIPQVDDNRKRTLTAREQLADVEHRRRWQKEKKTKTGGIAENLFPCFQVKKSPMFSQKKFLAASAQPEAVSLSHSHR